ncbi:hypothetical protein DV736_g455, partial [Chaetothyriales sp. CBS 134916]
MVSQLSWNQYNQQYLKYGTQDGSLVLGVHAKIHRQISRRPPEREIPRPCEEISVDWTDLDESYEGHTRTLFITDAFSGMIFPYFVNQKDEGVNLRILKDFVTWTDRQFKYQVKRIRSDHELARKRTQNWFRRQGIEFEPSAPHTQAQNGRAERSGGVVMEKARAMRIQANLPHDLWKEIVEAAVYLHNRTPRYSQEWRTPFEDFFSRQAGKQVKPQLAHLKVYGCRAYAMTKKAQLKESRLQKLEPRAHIGYLVGYNSTNIYRVWIPRKGRVISTRDVIFDEGTLYDGREDETATAISELDDLIAQVELAEGQVRNESLLEADEEVLDIDNQYEGSIVVFFFVDDIVFCYRKSEQGQVDQVVKGLCTKYKMSRLGELKWFLGINVIRDRSQSKLWLSQQAYIEMIANKYDCDRIEGQQKWPDTPMALEELLPYDQQASRESQVQFQKKVESILFAAITTRPDIAFAVSRLARFNQNPSDIHHLAADRVIRYLYHTRTYALEYGGVDTREMRSFICASDASYADNTLDRKSSQGYLMILFGGPIAWKSSKQDTVTTSSTEAELLALTQATKESLFISRLLISLGLRLNEGLAIQCDNKQTIRMITVDSLRLTTKLRHVDIHNHWLRQEYQAGRVQIEWTPTADMPADGLTKTLTRQSHERFVRMLRLTDISLRLATLRQMEVLKEKLVENRTERREAGTDSAPGAAIEGVVTTVDQRTRVDRKTTDDLMMTNPGTTIHIVLLAMGRHRAAREPILPVVRWASEQWDD